MRLIIVIIVLLLFLLLIFFLLSLSLSLIVVVLLLSSLSSSSHIHNFNPNIEIPVQFWFTHGFETMHKVWLSIDEVPCWFLRLSIKFQGHAGHKNRRFWLAMCVSGLWIQFEFTYGFQITHKAWHSIYEVPWYFPRSSIKFQGHRGWNIDDLYPIWVRLLSQSQLSNLSD